MKYCPVCGREYPSGESCPADGTQLVAERTKKADPFIGTVLKKTFHVEELIAVGGMGAVYRGAQMPLGRKVAIKVLLPALQDDRELVKRFFQEAKILSELSHPNVVALIDFGAADDGSLFLVTEFLHGVSLDDYVPADVGLPFAEVVDLMEQICAGVAEAHRNRLVHRDLKPANIFLVDRGGATQVKVLDLGIAKPMDGDSGLTQSGMLLGTPGYIAPEQLIDPSAAGPPSDIYSLGAILYYMVAGRAPYVGPSATLVATAQMTQPPDPIAYEQLGKPRAIDRVIARALDHEPSNRHPSVQALLDDLKSLDLSRVPQEPTVGFTQRGATAEEDHAGSGVPSGGLGLRTPAQLKGMPSFPSGWHTPTPVPRGRRPRRFLRPLLLVALVVPLLWWVGARIAMHAAADRVALGDPERNQDVQEPAADRLLFGMSAAFSGPAKELGREMRVGIETYFHAVNDAGGTMGRRLELIALDDGYEPVRTLDNMKILFADYDVFAVLGNVGTPTAEAAAPLAAEHKRIFFGALTGAPLLRKVPPEATVFNYRASYAQETAAMVRYFVGHEKIAAERIAVFAQDDGFGDAGFGGAAQALAQYGVDDPSSVLRVGYQRNSDDVSEAIAEILRHGNVGAVVMVATYRPAARFILGLRARIPTLRFANVSFVGSGALAEELQQGGECLGKGVVVTQVVPYPQSALPGVRQYREHLKAYYPYETPGFVSLEGYLVARLMEDGLARAGKTATTEALIGAFEAMGNIDLGIGVPLSFSPTRHQASDTVWGTVLTDACEYQSVDL